MGFNIICRLLNSCVWTHCISTVRQTFILFLITCLKFFISADHLKANAFYVFYMIIGFLLKLTAFSIVKLCWKIADTSMSIRLLNSPIPPCYTFYTFTVLLFLSDAFAKSWKATVICVMSVNLSVLPHGKIRFPS